MIVYEFISYSVPIVEAIIYFLLFDIFLESKYRSIWKKLFGVFILAGMIAICNYFFLHTYFNIIGIIVCAFVVSCVFYHGPMAKKLMVVVITAFFSIIIENCSAYFVAIVYGITLEQTVNNLRYRVIAILISKTLSIFLCNTIRVKCESWWTKINYQYLLLFLLLFSGAVFSAFLIFKMTFDLDKLIYDILSIICAIWLFISVLIAIYLYERFAKQSESLRLQEQYEQHLNDQLEHAEDLIAKREELLEIKHDMTNQLVTIQGYLKSNNIIRSEEYIADLLHHQQVENSFVYTGNTALDTIFSTKKAIAEKRGICFDLTLQIPSELKMQPIDQCIIFGNALDNAIEACEKCNGAEERFIRVLIVLRGCRLFCKISNSAHIGRNKSLTTQKEDTEHHGYGLINITKALAKYDSEPIIEQEETQFTLSFIIYED